MQSTGVGLSWLIEVDQLIHKTYIESQRLQKTVSFSWGDFRECRYIYVNVLYMWAFGEDLHIHFQWTVLVSVGPAVPWTPSGTGVLVQNTWHGPVNNLDDHEVSGCVKNTWLVAIGLFKSIEFTLLPNSTIWFIPVQGLHLSVCRLETCIPYN